MKNIKLKRDLYLFLNVIVLIFAFLRIPDLFNRPSAPFDVTSRKNSLIIAHISDQNACPSIRTGDRFTKWDSIAVRDPAEIVFLAELGNIGEPETITISREGIVSKEIIRLIPYYPSPRNIIVILFVGIVTWIFGILILIYGPETSAKTFLHLTISGLGLSVMLTTGSLNQFQIQSYAGELLFHVCYSITIGGFLYFSLLFPRPRTRSVFPAIVIFLTLLVITVLLIWYRLNAISGRSLTYLRNFNTCFDFFHFLIFVCIGGGLWSFIHSYRKSGQAEERLQIRWILWGVTIGSIPFLLLSILPQFFGVREFVAEEYTVVFFLAIPFAFTMAIVRYRLLDIDILISRTLVYGILTFFIGSAYFLVLYLVISAIGRALIIEQYFSVLLLTLLLTLFFSPIRKRVQRLVDDYLFTARAQYRTAVMEINRGLGSVYNTSDLHHKLVTLLAAYIPADNLAFYTLRDNKLELVAGMQDTARKSVSVSNDLIRSLSGTQKIFAVPGVIHSDRQGISEIPDQLMKTVNFKLVLPVLSGEGELYGILVCNPHYRKDHFIGEETDLLLTAAEQMSQNLNRILLQERIVFEAEEKKRLKAVNDLMSFYVSSVSHELKSPLSAILLHAELLKSQKKISGSQRTMHLDIIAGEGERLQRLIENILDISKIDRGARTYHFRQVNPNQIIEMVLKTVAYQINLNQIAMNVDLDKTIPEIKADSDALCQALINMIDNAVKYSAAEDRIIEIRSEKLTNEVAVHIRDNGIGIGRKEQKKIFSKFFRGADSRIRNIGGAGIGLTLVRHIVKAHHGRIKLKSEPDQGATFSIFLPFQF
jgi:signal transduction histidine kinase